MHSFHAMLKVVELGSAGHVCRMPDDRLPKRLILGELESRQAITGRSAQMLQGHPEELRYKPQHLGGRMLRRIDLDGAPLC